MKFEQSLKEGIFLKRYKRFFADIEFEGETLKAHVPNTGSMKTCNEPGTPCRFSSNDNPNRKLRYTLEMVKTPSGWVGVNTSLPNKLVRELWELKPPKHWTVFDSCQMEVKISDKTRIDMVMWDSQDHDVVRWNAKNLAPPLHLVEIKNVTLGYDNSAYFPDAVTTRGQKHIDELIALAEKGFTCELVFVVQRENTKTFAPADDIDPDYGKKLRQAAQKGVLITPLECDMSTKEVTLNGKILEVIL